MNKILLLLMLCLTGCALFKKTSKITSAATHSSAKQTEASQLILKSAGKETQIFTYWNDSGFYQFQNIKEQVDQAKSGQLNVQERQEARQELTAKKSEPVKTWFYAGIMMGVLVLFLVYKIYYRFHV